MKISQYLVKRLVEYKVTDVFGIPGGVILDFIYELDKDENIDVHLSCHEQAAAYAACGYAQCSGELGVAYATKGPGVTNMITAIAEAYYDSLPVLFITAHAQKVFKRGLRIEEEQEMDHVGLVSDITKYAKRIDSVEEAVEAIDAGCKAAVSGRKGPVLLDFSTRILKSEIIISEEHICESYNVHRAAIDNCIRDICKSLQDSERPVFLIGDGVRLSETGEAIAELSDKAGIPILSSRFSQDLVSGHENYFGYIGSHGLRYSNFILSKVDCIISFGNRMAFQIESESFRPIVDGAKIIRFDIDEQELLRKIPGSYGYHVDIKELFPKLTQVAVRHKSSEWLQICNKLKDELKDYDVNPAVIILSRLIDMLRNDETLVCDIGNNELLVSRAYAISGNGKKMLHSKAFKTVGSAIGKAIGAYYAGRKRVMCIVGDQGMQFNIQELQCISSNQLPIIIVICNNGASEMLKDSERKQGYKYNLHTTLNSGYSHPDFRRIADAYGIKYATVGKSAVGEIAILENEPQIIELVLDEHCGIQQYLPKGYPCQMFLPEMNRDLYEYLDNL